MTLDYIKFRGGFPPGRKGFKVVNARNGIVYSEHLSIEDASLAREARAWQHYETTPSLSPFLITDDAGLVLTNSVWVTPNTGVFFVG